MAVKATARSKHTDGSDGLRILTGGVAYDGSNGRERIEGIQRARQLSAVAEVAAERGVGNITVADIVARAGVSRRTFYELFNDCEDCFLAAVDDAIGRASRYVLDCYDPSAVWAEQIRGALAAILTFLDYERGAGQLLIVGPLGAGARAQELRGRVLAQMITVVDEGRKQTRAGPDLPPLTAEGVVGGALSVLHTRISGEDPRPAIELFGPLMGMIVLPYLGAAAARRELRRSAPEPRPAPPRLERNPLGRLGMRLTYRTVRVLRAIETHPGASNRAIGAAAEVSDQGQISKLLARLCSLGLIANAGGGASRGEPNAWALTDSGRQLQGALAGQAD